MSHVVVIGAGFSGLASALHLRGQGHDVTVVERDSVPGGRSSRRRIGGYTFDIGATVMTMPSLVHEAMRAVGADPSVELPMTRLDPAYRACFADGSTINVRFGHEAMRAEIEQTCSLADAAAFDRFVSWLRRLYDLEMSNFIDRNFSSPLDLVQSPAVAAKLLGMGGFRRLGPMIRDYFSDERLQRLFTFQAMYAGLPPESALAIYAVITYMDSIEGVYFPVGGMGAIPAAMATVAARAGVDFRYDTAVTEVARGAQGVLGVLTADELIRADAVVCTIDLPHAYHTILKDLRRPRAVRRPTYSPSAVVWHVGATGTLSPEARHHNIHFGHAWNTSFDEMMRQGRLMSDPSRLVTVPSITDASLAAQGGTTLYVLEPVPNLTGRVNWTTERSAARDRLATFLEGQGYPTDIQAELLFDPQDWQTMGMAAGTPFSLAHTFAQTGPFRPRNIEPSIPGLVFAGSGTTPGVGVPMVLISGKLAAGRVDEHLRSAGRTRAAAS